VLFGIVLLLLDDGMIGRRRHSESVMVVMMISRLRDHPLKEDFQ
jgi:hypothetical protein